MGILAKLQQVVALHKIGRKYNMGVYAHGNLISCKSFKSTHVCLAFLFSIALFILWQHIRNIKPQNGMA
jgi:hypothetical protein